jgi:hypothetical protein
MKLGQHEIVFFKMTAIDVAAVAKRCAPFALRVSLPEMELESVCL